MRFPIRQFMARKVWPGSSGGTVRRVPGDFLGLLAVCGFVLWVGGGAVGSVYGASETGKVWRTDTAEFRVDGFGRLASIRSVPQGREYMPAGQSAPVLSLRVDGRWHSPEGAEFDAGGGEFRLRYPLVGGEAVVGSVAKRTHWALELLELRCRERVEVVLWGPYPTTISNIIGETIGVVRDSEFAIGIQALNSKTLGGYPTEENDIEAGFSADDLGGYTELPSGLAKGQDYRGDTARPAAFGSVIQAYCRNRDRDRVISNWGHARYLAPAFFDGGVEGSRVALFAVPASAALDTLGAIEVAEGLPHPLLDGVWAKKASQARESYLIVDFGEATIGRAVEMTRRAGLRYLYHSSPFETWGHFRLKLGLFPNGVEGLRACVERAKAEGVRVGVHTLSNFITPNDPYVSPKPDSRLARIGTDVLRVALNAVEREVVIGDPEWFRKDTALNTVVIGEELIRYRSVSASAPWRLLECERGAWGTEPAEHAKGASVGRLMDHGYNVFLTDAALSEEVARNIAGLCNRTGIRQLSFDGLEGNWSTGMGQYGRTRFTTAWYEALEDGLRGQVINDASNPGHFNWHIYTRMNWGEPWYAGFRESQTLYRFRNQLYFERNLMPRMLGWFALRPETSVEDAEWLLARAAGFDAGFALASSLASTAQLAADPMSAEASRHSGAVLPILETIRVWETARMAGAFSPEVRALLRDNAREFHLEESGPGVWRLAEAHVERLGGESGGVGAGQWEGKFRNPQARQPLLWVLQNVSKQALGGLAVRVNGRQVATLGSVEVPAGGRVRYGGGAELVVSDSSWRERSRVPVEVEAAVIDPGEVRFEVTRSDGGRVEVKAELRTYGVASVVRVSEVP